MRQPGAETTRDTQYDIRPPQTKNGKVYPDPFNSLFLNREYSGRSWDSSSIVGLQVLVNTEVTVEGTHFEVSSEKNIKENNFLKFPP